VLDALVDLAGGCLVSCQPFVPEHGRKSTTWGIGPF
jgi:hypothetical protein